MKKIKLNDLELGNLKKDNNKLKLKRIASRLNNEDFIYSQEIKKIKDSKEESVDRFGRLLDKKGRKSNLIKEVS